jgi:hypothetical protein
MRASLESGLLRRFDYAVRARPPVAQFRLGVGFSSELQAKTSSDASAGYPSFLSTASSTPSTSGSTRSRRWRWRACEAGPSSPLAPTVPARELWSSSGIRLLRSQEIRRFALVPG